MTDPVLPPDPPGSGALARAQAVSRSLADAARRARFSARARSAYQRTGFENRRGDKAMRIVIWTLFALMVAIPNVVVMSYYALLATDQYVSEARFTVSSGAIPKLDPFGSVTGVPSMMIMQDTMIITNFIESRALVEDLERSIKLRDLYGNDSIDWWARFKTSKPIEKFTEYWEKMTKSSITFPAGIVTLTVRAFSAADAKKIAETVIARCEALINALNDRMRQDAVSGAEHDIERAAEQLKTARAQLEAARNSEGLLDVKEASKTQSELLTSVEGDILRTQEEYATQLHYVSEQAPQMRVLRARIAAMKAQAEELRRNLTTQVEIAGATQRTLSGKMTKFATLDLEHQIAEKRYAAAIATLDRARVMSERKMLYIHLIAAPAQPEDPLYPKRWLNSGLFLLASTTLWGTIVGLMGFVRNHMG